MSNIIASVLQFILPAAFKIIDMWLQVKDKEKKMTESYYNFLQQVDSSGSANVRQYFAAEDALKAKQKELLEDIEAAAKATMQLPPLEEKNPAVSPAMKREFVKRP